jgi:AraC family transcriptional regulator
MIEREVRLGLERLAPSSSRMPAGQLVHRLGDGGRPNGASRQWPSLGVAVVHAPAGTIESTYESYVIRMYVGSPGQRSWHKPSGPEHRSIGVGDLDIVPPGYRLVEHYDRPAAVLTLQLGIELIERAAEKAGLQYADMSKEPLMWVRDPKLQHLCWAIKEEIESRESANGAFGESLGPALAILLLCEYGSVSPGGRHVRQTVLRPVIDYIDKHLDSDLSLKRLANAGCISIDTLKRLFREAIGVSTHRYVVERRVAYATSLLEHSQLPIKDIALRAGFYDQSHMTRWMRRVAGITPTEIKSRTRAGAARI